MFQICTKKFAVLLLIKRENPEFKHFLKLKIFLKYS